MTVAAIPSSRECRLLFIKDPMSNRTFLIDTGSIVSLIPKTHNDGRTLQPSNFLAANGSAISTYGTQTITTSLGLRREFSWDFIVADVKFCIIGADFLIKHGLTVDLANSRLVDTKTTLASNGILKFSDYASTILSSSNNLFSELFAKFIKNDSPAEPHSLSAAVKHRIITTGYPVSCKPRPLPHHYHNAVKDSIDKMLKAGILRPSTSQWASPLHVVPKKPDGIRIVGDYRRLNLQTEKDSYSLPYLQDFSAELHGMTIFTRLDLRDAFFQIRIHPGDSEKTAIATPFGNFEYTRMSFGLCNASQTFQRFINQILWQLKTEGSNPRKVLTFAYIDDILIASRNEQEHLEDLQLVLDILASNGLKLNFSKCAVAQETLDFLGHTICSKGIRPPKEKVSALLEFPRPQRISGLRRFLGMTNYYRRFIPKAAEHLDLLYALIKQYPAKKKNLIIKWDAASNAAFEAAKLLLAEETYLNYPKPDHVLLLTTDASNIAIGATLSQEIDGINRPIAFYSKKLDPTQQNYSTFGRELLAISSACDHLKRYIEGRELIIFTDHKPILGAYNKPERSNKREERQLHFIAQFSPKLEHISGCKNVAADALSRADTDLHELTETQPVVPDASDQWQGIHAVTTLLHPLLKKITEAQDSDAELRDLLTNSSSHPVALVRHNDLYGEQTASAFKPFVPQSLRKEIFQEFHAIAHQGSRATLKSIRKRFYWPGMNKDIKLWARTCIPCQKAKVVRHNSAPVTNIECIGEKFGQVHIDIVGPIHSTNSRYRYLLTCVDRFSRWCEAFPILDTSAETVAKTFIANWIARFGVPITITSDQGTNFESNLFRNLLTMLGTEKLRTTAYHPQANALVERFHRTLKASLRASLDASDGDWVERLPLILLTLRTAVREGELYSPAQTVFGTDIRLPADLISPQHSQPLDITQYTDRLITIMHNVPAIKTRPCTRDSYLDPHLQTCTHVLVKNETKRGLQPVYNGPFQILARNAKFFKIQQNRRATNVSIDRLKAAHIESQLLTALAAETAPPLPHRHSLDTSPTFIELVPDTQQPLTPPISPPPQQLNALATPFLPAADTPEPLPAPLEAAQNIHPTRIPVRVPPPPKVGRPPKSASNNPLPKRVSFATANNYTTRVGRTCKPNSRYL